MTFTNIFVSFGMIIWLYVFIQTFSHSTTALTLYDMLISYNAPGLVEVIKDALLFGFYTGLNIMVGRYKASKVVKYIMH